MRVARYRCMVAGFVCSERRMLLPILGASRLKSGPGDSLAALPASAVVQLPLAPAVFVSMGPYRYDVRWIATGPTVHGKVVVREGVRPGASVVAHGLAALVQAAWDSLERRTGEVP